MAKESWIAQPQEIYGQVAFSPGRGTTGTSRDDLERSFAGATITRAFPSAAAVSLQAGQTMIPLTDATQRAALTDAVRPWDAQRGALNTPPPRPRRGQCRAART